MVVVGLVKANCMIAWHVAFTRCQQEVRAALELTNQDFRVFLPILCAKPMFPRYLFVQFDREIDPWGKIKSTRGCVDLLKDGYLPAIVPARIIEAIMAYAPAPEKPADGQTQFTAGDAIKITTGPLAGLEGLFVADRKARVMCLLELCGKRIEVPRTMVEAA